MRALVEAMDAVKSRGAVVKNDWEVECIQKVWAAHYDHVDAHHKNEDVLLVPQLKTRFHYPDKVRFPE